MENNVISLEGLTDKQIEEVKTTVEKQRITNQTQKMVENAKIREDLKQPSIFHSYGWNIWFKECQVEDAKGILDAFPVTRKILPWKDPRNEHGEIWFAIRTTIPAKYKSAGITIEWNAGDYKVRIEIHMRDLPEKFRERWFRKSHRPPTSSEFHYYTGMSQTRINNVRIERNTFAQGSQQGFYGGEYYLLDEPTQEMFMKEFIELVP